MAAKTIKFMAVAALLIFGVASSAMAHPDSAEKTGLSQDLVLTNFEHSLRMEEFPGIVESTIYNVVVFKSRFPQLDYAKVATMLQRVAKENRDASLTYKAELACLYLNLNGGFDLNTESGSSDHSQIFKQLSDHLAQKFLAAQQ